MTSLFKVIGITLVGLQKLGDFAEMITLNDH